MEENANEERLGALSMQALQTRLTLGRGIVRKLRRDWAGEDGADAALERYTAQVDEIREEIMRRRRARRDSAGLSKPEPTVVKAKLGIMGAKKARN